MSLRRAFVAFANPHAGAFDRHRCIRRDAPRDPCRRADHRVVPDHGFAPQNRGIGVDHDLVLDRGMAFGFANDLAGLRVAGEDRAQGDSLVKLDAVADLGCLADDDARAVIDEESAADRGAGVDVDARLAVCVFGHHSRNERHAQAVQHICQAINRHGTQARVAEDDLVETLRSRIAQEGGLDVLRERSPQLGNLLEKTNRGPFGVRQRIDPRRHRPHSHVEMRGRSVRSADHAENRPGCPHGRSRWRGSGSAAGRTRVEDLPQVAQDVDDFTIAGQRAVVEVMDRAAFVVGFDDPLRDLFQRRLRARSVLIVQAFRKRSG